MRPVFLDTVGLVAVWDESDQWYEAAESAYSEIVGRRLPVVTTTWVLMECGNAAARRSYRPNVDDLRLLLVSRNRLVSPLVEEVESAWSSYRRGRPGDAGIVDPVSFAVMRRLGMTRAFTNDAHFKAAGVETLF